MKQFKKGPIKAIRHVLSPSISLGYIPDFSEEQYNFYYKDPQDPLNKTKLSYFDNGIYGKPPSGKSGSIGFGLGNNLELKVRDKTDTLNGYRKIPILEGLNFGSSYNMAVDTMRWSKINFGGSTRLIKDIPIGFSGTIDPYAYDTASTSVSGSFINKSLYKQNGKLGRLTNFSFSYGGRFSSQDLKKLLGIEDSKKGKQEPSKSTPSKTPGKSKENPEDVYEPFDPKWDINANYSLSYTNTTFDIKKNKFRSKFINTLSFGLNADITKNWKFTFSSGYDFDAKQFTTPQITIFRDIHCWQMSFNAIPVGQLKSYGFRINIKSSFFSGLEYKKDKSWHDN